MVISRPMRAPVTLRRLTIASALRIASALTCLTPAAIGQDLATGDRVVLPTTIITGTNIPVVEGKTALPV